MTGKKNDATRRTRSSPAWNKCLTEGTLHRLWLHQSMELAELALTLSVQRPFLLVRWESMPPHVVCVVEDDQAQLALCGA